MKKLLILISTAAFCSLASASSNCDLKIGSKVGWKAMESAYQISRIADNEGSWKPWEKAICLRSGSLQSELYISMGEILNCSTDQNTIKQATDFFNRGGDVAKNCWENMSRNQVRSYYKNLSDDIGIFLKSIGL